MIDYNGMFPYNELYPRVGDISKSKGDRFMKPQLFAIAVLFLFAVPITINAQPPQHHYVAGGATIGASSGASYKNPAVGGFLALRFSKKRVDLRNLTSVEHEQKVFAESGSSFRNLTEVGIRLGSVALTGVLAVGSHHNEQYSKTATSAGVGFRGYFLKDGTVIEPFGYYLFPDFTSSNRVRRIRAGIELRKGIANSTGLFVNAAGGIDLFDNLPRTNLNASSVKVHVGLYFGRRLAM
jgi:hypothetical protein